MKLMTKEIEKRTPALYATDNVLVKDKVATARFFNPVGAGTWYMLELDPKSGTAFGLCHICEWELGYFDINELQTIKLSFGLGIERDICFKPAKLGEIGEVAEYLGRFSEIERTA